MGKRIDKFEISKRLLLARLGLDLAVEELYDELPEDPDGPTITLTELQILARDLFDNTVMPRLHEFVDGLPEVTEDDLVEPEPEPEPESEKNVITIMNTGAKMSWNSYHYDKFVFPKCGPEYTSKSFHIEFADGNVLHVANPASMTMTPDNMKYQPGGRWSGNNPEIPTMEVYARKDTHPEWVKAVFRHGV